MKTLEQFTEQVDHYTSEQLAIGKIKARHLTQMNTLKTAHKEEIAARVKAQTNAKQRLANWVKKHAERLFGSKGTGTYKTELSEVQMRRTPKKLLLVNKQASMDQQVAQVRAAGFSDAIQVVEIVRKESLELLTDDQLNACGYYRGSGEAIKIESIVKKHTS